MLAKLKLIKTPKGIDSVLMLSAILIIWIGNYSNIDLAIADSMFDRVHMQFSGAPSLNHGIVQIVLALFAATVILFAIWDAVRPLAWLAPCRTAVRVLALSALVVPATLQFLSFFSGVIGPADLLRYGGQLPYTRLLETAPASVTAMASLPATQAPHAWWLLALAVFWLPRRPRVAALVGSVMLLAGLAAGWSQQWQGAQFFSHTLWSAWIATFLVYLLYGCCKADHALA